MTPKKKTTAKKKPARASGKRPAAPQKSATVSRKAQHVELVVHEKVAFRGVTTGFERYSFEHNALPEVDFDEIDLSTEWLGRKLHAPLIISSMTGGYADAVDINRSLAKITEEFGLALGVGSGRQALEDDRFLKSFSVVREEAPTALIFANIGAIEVASLSKKGEILKLQKLIDLIYADALAIHLNPLQELLQPEGTRDFRGVLSAIEECSKVLKLPIIVKEVGAGISKSVAKQLLDAGVDTIDVAGGGGTSWAGVEILRNKQGERAALDPFWDWGIPTSDAVIEIAPLKDHCSFALIASGGISNGLEIAKSLALGADLAAIARPIMEALITHGERGLRTFIESVLFQLRGALFLTGSQNIAELKKQTLRTAQR